MHVNGVVYSGNFRDEFRQAFWAGFDYKRRVAPETGKMEDCVLSGDLIYSEFWQAGFVAGDFARIKNRFTEQTKKGTAIDKIAEAVARHIWGIAEKNYGDGLA